MTYDPTLYDDNGEPLDADALRELHAEAIESAGFQLKREKFHALDKAIKERGAHAVRVEITRAGANGLFTPAESLEMFDLVDAILAGCQVGDYLGADSAGAWIKRHVTAAQSS